MSGSAEDLLSQLRQCRTGPQWDRRRGRDIAAGVVEACREGAFECGSRLLAELLEECFIASYFADYPREDAPREVMELYQRLARDDLEFRDSFLCNEIRVRTNFSLLSDVAVP